MDRIAAMAAFGGRRWRQPRGSGARWQSGPQVYITGVPRGAPRRGWDSAGPERHRGDPL